ncbi:MAG TPA: CAP domain-containing protein [Planctomycetota bacterium]|nr:CAP domain-containing protein [Planctomycetota bacterium]
MSLQKLAAAPVLAFGLFVVGCQGGDGPDSAAFAAEGAAAVVMTDAYAEANEAELEALVNAHRAELDLEPVTILPELRELAREHSTNMGAHDPAFFDHRTPEGDLPEDRAARRIEFTSIGENIAAGQSAAEAVYRSWLASPSHRANLEDPRWTHMGAGHAVLPNSPYVAYWTLDLIQR